MIRSTDFDLYSVQAGAFVAEGEFRPRSVLALVLREFESVYDGEPLAFPLPEGVPRELPSLVLTSSDGTQRLQVARERIDLYWERRGDDEVHVPDILATFAERLVLLTEGDEPPIGRLAAVVMRSTAVEKPGRTLASQFCRDRWLEGPGAPLNRPEGFELHAHKVFALLPDLDVNSWIRIKTDQLVAQTYRRVSVQQDINTLAEERGGRRFLRQDLLKFYQAASRELDIILDRYFPAHDLGEEGPSR